MGRYSDLPIEKNKNVNDGNRYRKVPKYPKIPLFSSDIYVITVQGDRLDTLALRFYKNSEFWWIISIANELNPQNGLFVPVGSQLRIPINIQNILSSYKSLNNI